MGDDFDPAETPIDRTVHWDPVLRPPNRRRRIVVVSIIWVVVIAGVLVAQLIVTGNRKSQPVGAPTVTTTTTAPPTTRESVAPVVSGYQAVVDTTGTIAYDVPANWQVSHIGDGTQAQDGDWRLTLTMLAGYRNGYCTAKPTSARALSGSGVLTGVGPADVVAADVARHIADWAYGDSTVVVRPRDIKYRGRLNHLATATVTVHRPDACGATSALVDVSVTGKPGNWVVLVAVADQHFNGAVGQTDLDKIVTSLRTVTGR